MQQTSVAKTVYADIIDRPHHRSETRPHMSLYDRAAQFSSFDALAGYSDMIEEEARYTEFETELDESEREALGKKLSRIGESIAEGLHPLVYFRVFIPDERKAGGRYETIAERVKQIDPIEQRVIFESRTARSGTNRSLEFARIVEITIPRPEETE